MSLLEEIQNRGHTEQVFMRAMPEGGFRHSGEEMIGDCPVCGKRGKLYINLNRAVWNCFVCGEGGSWYSWLEKTEGLDKREAMIRLAEMAGIQLSQRTEDEVRFARYRASILDTAMKVMRQWLETGYGPRSVEVKRYLAARGYTDEQVQRMGLGAYESREALIERLKAEGYSLDDIKAAGLLTQGFGTTHELVIPWQSVGGETQGVVCRSLCGAEPKYKNSYGTAKDGLLGLGLARRVKWAVLVEGVLDALYLTLLGIPAIAVGGTSITQPQAQAITRAGLRRLILLFDQGDDPGLKATIKAVRQLRGENMALMVGSLPDGYKDPDEFVRALGPASFSARLEEAVSAAYWMGRLMGKRYEGESTGEQKEMIVRAREEISKWHWSDDAADFKRGFAESQGVAEWASGLIMDDLPLANLNLEKAVLAAALSDPSDAVPRLISQAKTVDFTSQAHRLIMDSMILLQSQGRPADPESVCADLHERGMLDRVGGQQYVHALTSASRGAEHLEAHVLMLANLTQRRDLRRGLYELAARAADEPAEQLIWTARAVIDAISDGSAPADALDARDAVLAYGKERKTNDWGWETGIRAIDDRTNGYTRGLTVMAARANCGKSRVALYKLCRARQAGAKVGFISLDMRHDALKYLSETSAAIHDQPFEWKRATDEQIWFAAGTLTGFNVAFDNCRSMWQISRLLRLWARRGVNIVTIDQAQNVKEYRDALRNERRSSAQIDAMVQQWKDEAGDLGICLEILHQINRDGVDKPKLENLKESGGWEEAANVVILLHDEQRAMIKMHDGFSIHETTGRVVKPNPKTAVFTEAMNPRPLIIDVAKARGRIGAGSVSFDFASGVLA